MRKILLYIVMLLPMFAIAQSTDQNWVKKITYKDSTKTAIATPTAAQAVTQVSYLDALGRPIQIVAHAQSNSGKDIVTHIEYDSIGRQVREYLPFVDNGTASLNIKTNQVSTFYGSNNVSLTGNPGFEITDYPFSEKQLENSPLNRVLKQAAPGEDWRMGFGNEIEFDYQTNTTADAVKQFVFTSNWDPNKGLYDIPTSLTPSNYNDDFILFKTITKDENWTSGNNNTTQEFKNKEGQVVLKRAFSDYKDSNGNLIESASKHDTYYIYDQFGNLTFVIPPLVDTTITITDTVLNNMCYQYRYDYRNRLVEKRLPGKHWEFIVYDKLDRVVATGPAYNPYGSDDTNKGWMLTKYDVFNRPVYTAWYSAPVDVTADRKALQGIYNNATTLSESKTLSVTTIDSISTKYTNSVTPSAFILLTVNYYDNYDYPDAPTVPSTLPDSTFPIVTNVKGLPTGSWVRVLDVANSTTSELSYTIYDKKFRPVRSYTKNYLGGYTQVDSKIDWAGKTEYTLTKHKRTSSSTELVTKDMFEYSAQDKLVKHKHKVNALPEQLLMLNTYDELGQLISKKVGGNDVTGATALQKVDYSYNIRGWLKGINNVNNLAPTTTENDLFAFKLSYNAPENGTPLYNGNISETFWRSDSDNIKRKYTYQYDNLNRLLEANYSKPNSASTTNNYMEHLTYDKGGNILTLKRKGDYDNDGSSVAKEIDNLEYIYDTNKLNLLEKVKDISTMPQGFKDDGVNVADDFTYDANGNMTLDNNKGITKIIYNHLNLPTKITFGANGTIEYIYNSVGQKVNKLVTDDTIPVATDYLSGFQYKDGRLQFFPTPEGYVNIIVGRSGAVRANYVFNYTDHLGNVRLSYAADEYETDVLVILEENHYYAFGLKHTNYNSDELVFVEDDNENIYLTPVSGTTGSSYKYKYNGKELQEELGLNMYDYGFRNYDPSLGRWMNIDPLAEIYHTDTPYAYVLNNPLSFIDPDGRKLIGVTKGDAQSLHDDLNSVFADSKFDKLRNLFTRGKKNDKTTFDVIGGDALKDALSGLTGDDLALAEIVTGAINSEAKHKIEYVKLTDDLSDEGEIAVNSVNDKFATQIGLQKPESYPNRTGADIKTFGGTGFNAPTSDGSHSFIVNDLFTLYPEGRRDLTTFHEIFGHGIPSAKKVSDILNNQNAIRTENLVRRVLGIKEQRDGADHAGGKVNNPSDLPATKN